MSASIKRSLFEAFSDAARTHGKNKVIVTDGDDKTYSYSDIMRAAFALSAPIKQRSTPKETIGILLPTGAATIFAFLAVHAAGRIPGNVKFHRRDKKSKGGI